VAREQDDVAQALVIQVLKKAGKPLTFSKIAKQLAGTQVKRTRIEQALARLVKKGQVVKVSDNRYELSSRTTFVTGPFDATSRGFGFVIHEDGDVFIPLRSRGGALPGDVVMAAVKPGKSGAKREGAIVQVIQRKSSSVVGIVEKKGRIGYLIPYDRRLYRPVVLAETRNVENGDVIVAAITRYPESSEDPLYAAPAEILGREGSGSVSVEVIIRSHGLPTSFPDEVIAEARDVAVFPQDAIERRRDLRDLFTVTIDGLDAKDFDDAVSCTREGENYRLWVHIADVAYYVRRESALDREARERAFSVYLVDRVIPMLPFELSNGICSLNPREDRLTMTVEMLIDNAGQVLAYEAYESVIRSDHRLTYEEVDAAFAAGTFVDPEVGKLMNLMRELSTVLEDRRLRRGALNFEIPEARVILDENGQPVDVVIREKTPATTIIEEAMIVTNETVAHHLYWLGYPCMYRIHEKPDPDSLAFVERFLAELGYPHDGVRTGLPREMQKVIAYAKERPEKILVNALLLRAMKQARYAPQPLGHFGLASQLYCHFTSPIRRYPDLVVHRLLKEALRSPSEPTKVARQIARNLPELSEHCSIKEREAADCERESTEVKLYELMARDHIGDTFEGIISGITSTGFFVELPNTAEGFVSFSDIRGEYFAVIPERFEAVGRNSGTVFRVGERVLVQVVSVSPAERRMDLALV
jgi:ribonuclease R